MKDIMDSLSLSIVWFDSVDSIYELERPHETYNRDRNCYEVEFPQIGAARLVGERLFVKVATYKWEEKEE